MTSKRTTNHLHEEVARERGLFTGWFGRRRCPIDGDDAKHDTTISLVGSKAQKENQTDDKTNNSNKENSKKGN